jgi:hypothetical protein
MRRNKKQNKENRAKEGELNLMHCNVRGRFSVRFLAKAISETPTFDFKFTERKRKQRQEKDSNQGIKAIN